MDLKDARYLGVARMFWGTEPLGHGKGQDAFGFNYYAKGIGEIKLNNEHKCPTIITPEMFGWQFIEKLHPYMQEFMPKAMQILIDGHE